MQVLSKSIISTLFILKKNRHFHSLIIHASINYTRRLKDKACFTILNMYNSKKGKRLYKFLEEKQHSFELHFSDLQLQINETGIHDLRVVIKRFKAIYQLIELLDSKFVASKKFASLKKLFKPAGNLREIQVNRKTLFKHCPDCLIVEHYTILSESIISESTQDFKLALKDFKLKKHQKIIKEIKQIAKELSGKELKQKAFSYISAKIHLIQQFLLKEKTEGNVHEVRIALKQISAIIMLLGHIKPDYFTNDLYVVFKKAEDEIGEWHDMVRLRDSVSLLSLEAPIEKQELSKLLFSISRKNEHFIQNLDKTIAPPMQSLTKLITTLSSTV